MPRRGAAVASSSAARQHTQGPWAMENLWRKVQHIGRYRAAQDAHVLALKDQQTWSSALVSAVLPVQARLRLLLPRFFILQKLVITEWYEIFKNIKNRNPSLSLSQFIILDIAYIHL